MFARQELCAGYTISRLIKGHWQVAEGHRRDGALARDEILSAMRGFIAEGMTTFDVADIYTGAEELIGDFIRREKKAVELHTKYVPDLNLLNDLTFADTAQIIERSLKRLDVDQLDLVQFHWWDYAAPKYVEAALSLKKLQEQGKIRHIGVTNFDEKKITEMLDAGVDIASAQVQYSVLDRRPRGDFADFCQKNGIGMLCYGGLSGGYLSDKYLGLPDTENDVTALANRSLTKYRLIIEEAGGWDNYQRLLRVLKDRGEKRGLGISEAALSYVLNQPGVTSAIVGAHSTTHLDRLKTLQNASLLPEDIAAIDLVRGDMPEIPGAVYQLERSNDRHKGIMKYNLNRAAS